MVVAESAQTAEQPLRVLVLDDEKALLPLLDRYLRKLGYAPTCFPDAASALEAFHAAETRFDLVMTDLTLEGISGEEVARNVLAADDRVRVVVMSGYPFSTDHFDEAHRPRVTFLQKPFLPSQIQEAVERGRSDVPGDAPAPATTTELAAKGVPPADATTTTPTAADMTPTADLSQPGDVASSSGSDGPLAAVEPSPEPSDVI
jgi:DNA-binding NtrC family response regulator